MKKIVFNKEYSSEDLIDVSRDIHDAWDSEFNPAMAEVETKTEGSMSGTFHIRITWCSEDDCECTGFTHYRNCPNHVMHG